MEISSLLTVQQVADRLNVSHSTIYDLVAQGQLSCYRIGARGRGTIRFTEEMLEAYLSRCRHEGEEDEPPPVHLR